MKIYSIYDSKAAAYSLPFYHENDALAQRMLIRACLDPQSNLFHFAADYILFDIGTWDEIKGIVKQNKANINIGGALELRVNNPEAEAAFQTLTNPNNNNEESE